MAFKKFEDIPIWQESIVIAKHIYNLTNHGRFATDFGLRDQIRRAIVSVSSNIVEGFERNNNREFRRFLFFSKASAHEARNQMLIAREVGYVDPETANDLLRQLKQLADSIGGFISYLKKYDQKSSKSSNPAIR